MFERHRISNKESKIRRKMATFHLVVQNFIN